jgi:hypothetical protein
VIPWRGGLKGIRSDAFRDYLLISFVGDPLEGIPAELKLPFGFILFSLQHLHNASIIRCFGKIKNPAFAGLI